MYVFAVLGFLLLGSVSFAQEGLVSDFSICSELQPVAGSNEFQMYYAKYDAPISCEKLQHFEDLLGSTAVGIQAASIYAACTGVGAPVAIKLQVASFGTQFLKFVVSKVPCVSNDEADIQERINNTVCVALNARGISCDPDVLSPSRTDI